MFALPEVRFRAECPARSAPVSEVRRAVPAREDDEARRSHRVLQQSELRLQAADHRGRERLKQPAEDVGPGVREDSWYETPPPPGEHSEHRSVDADHDHRLRALITV